MEQSGRLSLLAVYAHPDDESFITAGTIARYAREGVHVSLVCATRGEVGEISDPDLATPETLGQVREEELRRACSLLGIQELRLLGYIDGTLPQMERGQAEGKVVRAMRELRPQVVITFGPEGGGSHHPDHVTVHEWTVAAFRAAADATAFPEQLREGLRPYAPLKLYCVAQPRERYLRLGQVVAPFVAGTNWEDRDWSTYGVPDEHITTCVDTSTFADLRLQAIATHQTQFSPRHPYAVLPHDLIMEFFKQECFILAESRVGQANGREDDLFRGIN